MKAEFMKQLAANEDDALVRACFADWLEENGEPEEAERHRKWPASKAWLLEFAQKLRPYDADNGQAGHYSYKEMMREIAIAKEIYASGTDLHDLREFHELVDPAEFFMHVAIVTGITYDPGEMEYTCSC